MEQLSSYKIFDGLQNRYTHHSDVLNCEMNFSVFMPLQAQERAVPVLYWLSGLTCTDENFVTKAGAQRAASEFGIAIVAPDTSPRGEGVADDPEGAWDFGLGAGFYVNATQSPWQEHYQMYDYVRHELPALVSNSFNVDASRTAISGHSMGGHGALTLALNNADYYQSVSAFSPICAPSQCPWGQKALGHYLGDDQSTWARHDTVALVKAAAESGAKKLAVLVDQGSADTFLEEQLKTPLLVEASHSCDYPMRIRMQPGYDHSYFFIASFIGEHLKFHAQQLGVEGVPL